jgi:hypothetical protein
MFNGPGSRSPDFLCIVEADIRGLGAVDGFSLADRLWA